MKSTALSFSLWNARWESPARGGPRHAFICGGRATTTCMNLPCLCFVEELLDQEEIETDVPKATSQHVRAGHGQRAVVVWEWELLAAAEPVQNWPKVTLGARLPSRIHVQVRRGHVSPHEHGADHALHGLAWVAAAGFS